MKRQAWLWRLAARNLLRNRRRNLITGMALAGAYAGILLFTGYVVWVEKYLRTNTVYLNQLGHLLIERPDGLARQLTTPQQALMSPEEAAQALAIIKDDPAVSMVSRGLQSLVLAVRDCQSRGVLATARDSAVEARILDLPAVRQWNAELIHPELVAAAARLAASSPGAIGVIPTPDLRRLLDRADDGSCRQPASPPASMQLLARTIDGYTSALDATVLGTQSTGLALLDARTLYLPIAGLQRLLETERIGYVAVYVHSLLDLPGLYLRLKRSFASAGLPLAVMPFFSEEVGLYYIGSVAFLAAVASFFVLLVTAVVGLTLLSLFSITVAERGAEIGVLLALGFPEQKIAKLFEAEAVLLTLLSLVTGLGSALLIGSGLYARNIRFSPPGIAGSTRLTIAWEPWVVILIALLLLLAAWSTVRLVTKLKLRSSAVALLQGSTTL